MTPTQTAYRAALRAMTQQLDPAKQDVARAWDVGVQAVEVVVPDKTARHHAVREAIEEFYGVPL